MGRNDWKESAFSEPGAEVLDGQMAAPYDNPLGTSALPNFAALLPSAGNPDYDFDDQAGRASKRLMPYDTDGDGDGD